MSGGEIYVCYFILLYITEDTIDVFLKTSVNEIVCVIMHVTISNLNKCHYYLTIILHDSMGWVDLTGFIEPQHYVDF